MNTKNNILGLLLLVFGFVLMSSCESQVNDISDGKMKVSDFDYVGELHNKAMTYTMVNIDNISFEKEHDNVAKAKKILSLDKEGLQVELVKHNCIDNPEKYASFMLADDFGKYLLSTVNTTRTVDMDLDDIIKNDSLNLESAPSLYQMLYAGQEQGVYSAKTVSFIQRIVKLLQASLEGMISDDNFLNEINVISDEFDKTGYDKDSAEGAAVASMLSVAKSSYQWWSDNPNYIDSECQGKLPHIVAMDLGGACAGVLLHSVQHWNDRLTWGGVGNAALWGAISGSTGLGGRIARLFM